MKEKTRSTIWWLFCTLLFIVGEGAAFFFAWYEGTWLAVMPLVGFVVGYFLAPIVHELGHIAFAKKQGMAIAYAKFAFLKITEKRGKNRLSFASPFATDETQILPKKGGDMLRRARLSTIGGLVFGGAYFALLAIVATVLTIWARGYLSYAVLGLLPYGGYLFLLNVMPCRFTGGKTDMLVYLGLKRGYDEEKTMVAAMEIQGRLGEGKSYGEIDETWYFDLPQLSEEEPLFAMMLDLQYRYYLDKGDTENAAERLNRLALAQDYLSEAQVERIAAELTYMHVVTGDMQSARACAELCEGYLQSDRATAKRILAAVAYYGDRKEDAALLKERAYALLEGEKIVGERKFEENLLARLA